MTELHHMSVPPRTRLRIKRASLEGRRYRVDIAGATDVRQRRVNVDRIRRQLPRDGTACLLPLVQEAWWKSAPEGDAAEHVREACARALDDLQLPDRLGFFVHEPDAPEDSPVPTAAAIAILAARSGPLYVPGRFEPSLMTIEPVTLFFPSVEEDDHDHS